MIIIIMIHAAACDTDIITLEPTPIIIDPYKKDKFSVASKEEKSLHSGIANSPRNCL